MEMFLAAVTEFVSIQNIFFCLVGVTAGIMVGAIPCLTAAMAVAVLTSFTFGMEAFNSFAYNALAKIKSILERMR